MTLRIAFTGTGHMAQTHARAAKNLPDIELTAVVNHRRESRAAYAERFGISRQFDSVAALLADGAVDALVVSTPNVLHAPETIAALAAGVHVLVEKPMAMDAADAQAMTAASVASGAKLMVAHCWRFDEEVNWLKRQIDSGRLGKILRTKGYGVHVNWGPDGWFVDDELAGGGALADMGIHAIDTARYLLGDPQPSSVYARISSDYTEYTVDDCGTIWINWGNGATSLVESGWWWPHADGPEAGTQVYGAEGFGQIFPTRLELPDRAAESVNVIESGYKHPRDPHCPQTMYDRQLEHFVDCIRRDAVPGPDAEAGLINMRIVDAALESSRRGEVVRL
jgi:predicted dehydrogenase